MQVDPLLAKIYSLFGSDQTLLIPIKDSQLVDPRWQNYTVYQSRQPANQALLAASDLAVVCGPESHNLVALQFASQGLRQMFLNTNPGLEKTLQTSFEGKFFLWLRFRGWSPRDYVHPYFTLLSNTAVMVGERATPSVYHFDNESPVLTVNFKDVLWHLEIATILADQRGRAHELRLQESNGPGRPKAQDEYILSVFRSHHDNVWFEPGMKVFYTKDERNGRIQPLYVEEVKKLLHQTLVSLKTHHASGTGNNKVMANMDTGLRHLARLTGLLKILAVRRCKMRLAAPPPPPSEELVTFEAFVAMSCKRRQGEAVTLAEAYDAYLQFCVSRDCSAQYSQRQFLARLRDAVNRKFGLVPSHNLIRDGRAKRGYRNLWIKLTADLNSAQITDATDGRPNASKESGAGVEVEANAPTAG